MTNNIGTPLEFSFPKDDAGKFISTKDLQEEQDAAKILEISKDTKALPHLIKKVDGVWLVNDMTIEDYKKFWEGNDNSELYKR